MEESCPFQPSRTSRHPSEWPWAVRAGREGGVVPALQGAACERLVGSDGPQGPSGGQWARVGPSPWPLLSYHPPSHLPGPQGALFLSTLDLCLCCFLCREPRPHEAVGQASPASGSARPSLL